MADQPRKLSDLSRAGAGASVQARRSDLWINPASGRWPTGTGAGLGSPPYWRGAPPIAAIALANKLARMDDDGQERAQGTRRSYGMDEITAGHPGVTQRLNGGPR